MIDGMLGAGLPGASKEARARELVEDLVRRKQELFAAARRAILSFEVTDTGDGFHLSVVSIL